MDSKKQALHSYQKISITFFMITLSKIFSRHHSPKGIIFVTAYKRSAACGRRVLPFRQRPRDITFPQVAACGCENPAFQAAET
jgi:hypothetical protein